MRCLSLATLLALVTVSVSASAQRSRTPAPSISGGSTPIELGFDAGINFGFGGSDNSTAFELPLRSVRAGFFVSPQWSIEPSIGLARESDGGGSSTQYAIGVGALYHFSPSPMQSQVYARPFVDFLGTETKFQTSPTSTNTVSSNVTELGGGLGVKIPWRDRLATRLEVNVSHLSQKLASGENRLGLLAGVSYLTR